MSISLESVFMCLLTVVLGFAGFSINSRFDSVDSQFVEVREDLSEIREEISDVAQRTSNIEGRLSVEVLDEEEPETLAAEAP